MVSRRSDRPGYKFRVRSVYLDAMSHSNQSQLLDRRALLRSAPPLLAATACARLNPGSSQGLRAADPPLVGPLVTVLAEGRAAVRCETPAGIPVRVEWGTSTKLDRVALPKETPVVDLVAPRGFGTSMYEALLEGLEPGCRYVYRFIVEGVPGPLHAFRAPPAAGSRAGFRFVVTSDSQHHPEVHRRIAERGMLALTGGGPPEDSLAFVLMAGDLVDLGHVRSQWSELVFEPLRELSGRVPLYAALGNHEDDAEFFFEYLGLPRRYGFTYGNCRFLTLDTNTGQRTDEQLAWLDAELAAFGADPALDLVFACFHHPYKSEIWPVGEIPYSGEIVRRLEAVLTATGKAGAYFFGHTHAYSRGQSKDCRLYWVNAGSAGGKLDRFGSLEHAVYPEYQRTFDEYGFLAVEVNPGGEPGFLATRYSFGHDEAPKDGEIQDAFGVGGSPSTVGDPLEAEWQIATTTGFDAVLESRWLRREKVYGPEDRSLGAEALAKPPCGSWPAGTAFARVRYRDDQLVWGPWSEPMALNESAETAGR